MTPADDECDCAQHHATREEGDKPKNGAYAKADLYARASAVLNLHQMFIHAWRMEQHIQ